MGSRKNGRCGAGSLSASPGPRGSDGTARTAAARPLCFRSIWSRVSDAEWGGTPGILVELGRGASVPRRTVTIVCVHACTKEHAMDACFVFGSKFVASMHEKTYGLARTVRLCVVSERRHK